MKVGEWYYSTRHTSICKIIETHLLFGETSCRIWLPNKGAVDYIHVHELKPIAEANICSLDHIKYITAAARIIDSMNYDVLLAPIESSVIPLPHQIRALSRAIENDGVRYLLADEVGLGKTIEAGLIMRELKLRGRVKRTLVVVPRGLLTQWVAEMKTHFKEEFNILIPGDFSSYRQIIQEDNIWKNFSQVICPIDSVKPIDSRQGWSKEQVAKYNEERYEDLISAGWDLIIIDEAHRLGGSTDQVARYKLGQGLAEAAPYLLFLSATPHQGKTDAFYRFISLLDREAFPDVESVTRERVMPYVIRTEKKKAIDAEGNPLFKPRRTQMVPISWEKRHQDQRFLYDTVTEYVRVGYNQAMKDKRNYIGFLLLLMQRLVASSTQAIRKTLERRLERLEGPMEDFSLFSHPLPEDWKEMDGQEQVEAMMRIQILSLEDERNEVMELLRAAKRCGEKGSDIKAEALLEWIYRLQQEEGDPELKLLVFTEFVPTQQMLYEFLTARGFSVALINGSMNMTERKLAQEHFANDARILVSTDAGGEGLNLQFCHVVINYDIPWNPMRLEQRIGRVDRIGQNHTVRAINFALEDSVEHRVLEVLDEKLTIILTEFGIDKTSDVLDSLESAEIFDDLYVHALLNPQEIGNSIQLAIHRIKDRVHETKESIAVLGEEKDLEPGEAQRLLSHPLPYWVERMTISYIRAHGGQAKRLINSWEIIWPHEVEGMYVVFSNRDAKSNPGAHHLTLEEDRVRRIIHSIPRFVPGQLIPAMEIDEIPKGIKGFWSLWSISLLADDWKESRIFPLFLHDDGRVLVPTARRIWDELLSTTIKVKRIVETDDSYKAFHQQIKIAEEYGKSKYKELLGLFQKQVEQEFQKGEYSFSSRTKAIERLGLPTVRNYRLQELEKEKSQWREKMQQKERVNVEMKSLLIIRIEEGDQRG